MRQKYGTGSAELFGRTGVDLEWWVETHQGPQEPTNSVIPELGQFARAVVSTPDFKRWKDLTGNAHVTGVGKAIEKLTGQSVFDLDRGHPYSKVYYDLPKYKSEWPSELLEATEKAYAEMMGGDRRKLNYYNSGGEVWARMVEQYVATKLAAVGISNPWLTQLSYDTQDIPQMMDQEVFEEKILPLLDAVFQAIKDRSLVAKGESYSYGRLPLL